MTRTDDWRSAFLSPSGDNLAGMSARCHAILEDFLAWASRASGAPVLPPGLATDIEVEALMEEPRSFDEIRSLVKQILG